MSSVKPLLPRLEIQPYYFTPRFKVFFSHRGHGGKHREHRGIFDSVSSVKPLLPRLEIQPYISLFKPDNAAIDTRSYVLEMLSYSQLILPDPLN